MQKERKGWALKSEYIYITIYQTIRGKNKSGTARMKRMNWGRYDTYLRFNIEYTSPALIKDVLDGSFACTVVVAREFCGLDKGVLGTEFEEGFFVGEVVGFAVLFAFAGGAGCVCTSV